MAGKRVAKWYGRSWRLGAIGPEGPISIENQGYLDEVVLDQWFHLERMDKRLWWLRVGDARLMVSLEDGGRVQVEIERDFY